MKTKLLATVLALVLVAVPSSTLAAGCQSYGPDQEGNWHAYALKTGYPTITAVSAEILEYRPYVPFELIKGSASSAWVMLSEGGQPHWAQIGWVEMSINWRKVMVQYWNGSSYTTQYLDPMADWTSTRYTVQFQPVNGQWQWQFFANGTVLVYGGVAFDPDQGEVASEITNLKAQMPGDFGAHAWESFNNMVKRLGNPPNETWYAYAPSEVGTSDNTSFYASNARGGMDPQRQLVTADKRGDCS